MLLDGAVPRSSRGGRKANSKRRTQQQHRNTFLWWKSEWQFCPSVCLSSWFCGEFCSCAAFLFVLFVCFLPPPTTHTCSASAIELTWSSPAHHHTLYLLHSDVQLLLDGLPVHTVGSGEVELFDFLSSSSLLTCLNPCFCFEQPGLFFFSEPWAHQQFTLLDPSSTLSLHWFHPHQLHLLFIN